MSLKPRHDLEQIITAAACLFFISVAPRSMTAEAELKVPANNGGDVAKAPICIGVQGWDREVAEDLVEKNGGTPWLFVGRKTQIGELWIYSFCKPAVETPRIRRGIAIVLVLRSGSGGSEPKLRVRHSNPYAQVAIEGRDFDQIEGTLDLNLPFRVIGTFNDNELIGLVNFVRSEPSQKSDQPARLQWPIEHMEKKSDGSIEVWTRKDDFSGERATIRQVEGKWIVVSFGRWIA
jgi:hypothetical protein